MYHNSRTRLQLPFRHLEPTFFSGLLDDPLILLRNRPDGSNMLIDCGQIHHLAKRVLKAVDTIFISHAHMDHFMGMASFVRNILVSTKTVDIFGPPALSVRLENLLSGFDWNLCENFWCSLRVHEIDEGLIKSFILRGPDGFSREHERSVKLDGKPIFSNNQVAVTAAQCDHKIPSMIYRIDEKPVFLIDDNRLKDAGLVRGDWLKELNSRYNRGILGETAITVLISEDGNVMERSIDDPSELFDRIRADQTPSSLGYVCDVGFSRNNLEGIQSLLSGVTLLIAESTYLAADKERARSSRHLCTTDLNRLMQEIRPKYVLPIHVSKSYNDNTDLIFQELRPPVGTSLLRLPDHIAPKPLLPDEIESPRAE